MPENNEIVPAQSGEEILPAFNAVVAAVNRFQRDYAADYALGDIDDGARLLDRDHPPITESFLGIIVARGPNNEVDRTDSRYWVSRYAPNSDRVTDLDSLAGDVDSVPRIDNTVTAFNLAEYTSGAHALAAGELVFVFAVYTVGTLTDDAGRVIRPMPLKRYVFTASADDLGELDGQVEQMTSQRTKGWADLRLVNR